MYKDRSYIAIIPAREGSKHLPGKNMRVLAGHPLVAWSIMQALEVEEIDKVVVTTDSDAIAGIASAYHCESIIRPFDLCQDGTPVEQAILHVLYNVGLYDYVVLLQPTSPLRLPSDIKKCIEMSQAGWFGEKPGEWDLVLSTCKERWFNWGRAIYEDFAPNGAVYVRKTAQWLQSREIDLYATEHIVEYPMPAERSVDIDHELDFRIAQMLMEERE